MTIRWGVAAAGKISHDWCNAFNSYPDKPDVVIAAVAARDKTRAAAFAKLHNIPKVFESYQALATSDAIDAAYVGSLNPDHYNLTKLFLENGKHVLCEKPLCMSYKQVQSLVNLARKKKLFLMEAVWSRFSPAYEALEKQIKSGKFGDITYVEATFGVPIGDMERIEVRELGGGAVLDLGVYTLQFAQLIFKEEPKKLTAVGELSAGGVDLVDTIILEYEGDRRAVLNINARIKLRNDATVYGTKGYVAVPEPFHFPTELIYEDGSKQTFPLHDSDLHYNFTNSPGLVYETLEASRCIKQGLIESPKMPHSESLLLAKLEESVRKQVGVHFAVDDQEFP